VSTLGRTGRAFWHAGGVTRTTLVTGLSRRHGIGFAIAERLLREQGARVFAHSYSPYDATEPWGADPDGISGVLAALGDPGDRLGHVEADLANPAAPCELVKAAVEHFGSLDALVVNHARSQMGTIDELEVGSLDLTRAVNLRA
jgi:3-oxoacyl-[acyl-carrier protein] reductase